MKRYIKKTLASLLIAAILLPVIGVTESNDIVYTTPIMDEPSDISDTGVFVMPSEEEPEVTLAPTIAPDEEFDDEPNATVSKKLTLGVGETYTFKLGKNLTFKSSKTKVATVSKKGVVTAKKKGKTVITVKKGKKTLGKCTVTVKGKPGSVSIVPETIVLNKKGTAKLKAKLPKNTASNKLTWKSSKKKVVKVDASGKITALKTGTAKITVTTYNKKKATCTVKVIKGTAPTTLTLDVEEVTLDVGGTHQLVPQVNAGAGAVYTYTSDKPEIAAVSDAGVITGVKAGTAKITVKTHNGLKKTVTVTVTEQPAPIAPEPEQITPEPEPITPAPVTPVPTVTATPTSTTMSTATPTVTTTATPNATPTVTPVAVTSIELDYTELTLKVGRSKGLIASIYPEDADCQSIIWESSNENIATVDGDGTVLAIAQGSATISAITEDGSKTATCEVTVVIPVARVELNKSYLTLAQGESETLIASIQPSTATNQNIEWMSSNTAVATVDNMGVVTAQAAGSARITAKTIDGGKTASCTVYVTGISVPTGVKAVANDDGSISVTWNKASGCNGYNVGYRKEGDAVTANAHVEGIDATSVTIQADKLECNTIYYITVTGAIGTDPFIDSDYQEGLPSQAVSVTTRSEISVTGLKVDRPSAEIYLGESMQLTPSVLPENATNKGVMWTSSDESVATVNAYGIVTAWAIADSVTITATTVDGGFSVSKKLRPRYAAPKHANAVVSGNTITLSWDEVPYAPGYYVKCGKSPAATNPIIVYVEGNENTATTITGLLANTLYYLDIYVEKNGQWYTDVIDDYFTVTTGEGTTPIPVTGVNIEGKRIVYVGSTMQLSATIKPEQASNKAVTWTSSNTSVAKIDANGLVTGLKQGSADITVTTKDGGLTCTHNIFVDLPEPDNFSADVDGTTVTLAWDRVYGAGGYKVYYNTRDASSDATCIDVGKALTRTITGLKANKKYYFAVCAYDTVEDGYWTDWIILTMGTAPQPTATTEPGGSIVTSVSLNKDTLSMTVGSTITLQATVLPTTALNKTLKWQSTNVGCVSVDNNGKLTASKTGKATIFASATDGSGKYASCEVEVTDSGSAPSTIMVTAITLNKNRITLSQGNSATLTATVAPSNATNQSVTWVSSNKSVVTVSNGRVYAAGKGTATISANAADGSGVYASCTVTVEEAVPGTVYGDWTDPQRITMTMGETYQLHGTVGVNNGTLGVVSVSVYQGSNQALTHNYTGSTSEIDLSQESYFEIDTVNDADFSAEGTYTIVMYAKAYGSSSAVKIGEKTLVIEPVQVKTPSISIAATSTTNLINTKESKVWVGINFANATRINVQVLDGSGKAILFKTAYHVSAGLPETSSFDYDVEMTETSLSGDIGIVFPKGIAVGNYTISVTASNAEESTLPAVISVRVGDGTIAVTSVKLNKTNLTLTLGQTETLTATIYPSNATNKAVTWESSNTKVATVNNGTIKAVGEGTSTVTVRTENGNKEAICNLVVLKQSVAIRITKPTSDSNYIGYIGDGNVKNNIVVGWKIDSLPDNATIQVALYPDNINEAQKEQYCVEVQDKTISEVSFDGSNLPFSGCSLPCVAEVKACLADGTILGTANQPITVFATRADFLDFEETSGCRGKISDLFELDNTAMHNDLIKLSVNLSEAAYSESKCISYLKKLGFVDFRSHYYDSPSGDYVGVMFAQRTYYNSNGKKSRVYVIALRGTTGGMTGNEWISNLKVGEEGHHEGFEGAYQHVMTKFGSYENMVESYDPVSDGYRKLWVTGHSRGGAVADLVAFTRLNGAFNASNVYAYTFAAPCSIATGNPGTKYIYNFVIPGDFVPNVPMKELGFSRIGRDVTLQNNGVFGEGELNGTETITLLSEMSKYINNRKLFTNVFNTVTPLINSQSGSMTLKKFVMLVGGVRISLVGGIEVYLTAKAYDIMNDGVISKWESNIDRTHSIATYKALVDAQYN